MCVLMSEPALARLRARSRLLLEGAFEPGTAMSRPQHELALRQFRFGRSSDAATHERRRAK